MRISGGGNLLKPSFDYVLHLFGLITKVKFFDSKHSKALHCNKPDFQSSQDCNSGKDNVFYNVSFCKAFQKLAAFTLAEVLITLGIIGVVAALTIPNLIAKAREKATVVQVKETYSILSQGFRRAIDEFGEVSSWCTRVSNSDEEQCEINMANRLSHFMTLSPCNPYNTKCLPDFYKTRFKGDSRKISYPKRSIYVLNNGAVLSFEAGTGDNYINHWCTRELNSHVYIGYCGRIHLDINGASGQNVDGKDLFMFKIYQDGIAPLGHKKDVVWLETFNNNCMGRQ